MSNNRGNLNNTSSDFTWNYYFCKKNGTYDIWKKKKNEKLHKCNRK